MLGSDDPAEVLLAREALRPTSAELIAPLWAKAQGEQTPPGARFRALIALAAYDPNSSHWQKAGPEAVEHLLWANPLHRELWTEALRPIGQALLAPLAEASYFPLKVGTKWHYRWKNSDGEAEKRIHQIIKTEQIDGRPLARLEARAREGPRSNQITTEHLSTTAKGVFRHRFNGIDVSPPLCLLRFPIKTGETWESPMKVGDEQGTMVCRVDSDEIEVPAGKHKTVWSELEFFDRAGTLQFRTKYWFAPSIGIVKQTIFTPPSSTLWLTVGANTVLTMNPTTGVGPYLAASYFVHFRGTITIELEMFEEGK
jgi:hypothetical protein